jgi:hypothetical protein
MVELDIRYAERLSLALDLKIMLLTLPVLVLQVLESAGGRAKLAAPSAPARPATRQLAEIPVPDLPKRDREFQRS